MGDNVGAYETGRSVWYYHADDRVYYWTVFYNMSAAQFARTEQVAANPQEKAGCAERYSLPLLGDFLIVAAKLKHTVHWSVATVDIIFQVNNLALGSSVILPSRSIS